MLVISFDRYNGSMTIESKCCIGVRIYWLLKGASKVQIHDQNSSQSLIFKAFHCSVGRVPWQINNTFIGISYLQNRIKLLQFAPVCQAAEVIDFLNTSYREGYMNISCTID